MKYALAALLLATVWLLAGCYKDNAEDLYPASGTCEVTNVGFAAVVQPLVRQQCAYSGCHDATGAGGYNLSTYAGLKSSVDNGRLLGVINHQSGYSPMPKGGTKLPDCQIRQVSAWVSAGAPNN